MSKKWNYVLRNVSIDNHTNINCTLLNRIDYGFGVVHTLEQIRTFKFHLPAHKFPDLFSTDLEEKNKYIKIREHINKFISEFKGNIILESIKTPTEYKAVLWTTNRNLNHELIDSGLLLPR